MASGKLVALPCLHNGYHQPGHCPEANAEYAHGQGAPIRIEFRSAAEKEAYFAHLAPDDPVRRQIGGFDFPNILDESEAGYR